MRIKGQEYKITFFKDSRGFAGLTKTDEKEILIELNPDDKEIQKTIIHELLHAYFYECGLIGYCGDETLVGFLENIYPDLTKSAMEIFEKAKGGAICE